MSHVWKRPWTICSSLSIFTARYAAIDYRRCEISAKSQCRIFRVTFTRPDWRRRIFEGERVAAFSTTTIGAAASENFLVVSDKKFEPRSDGNKIPYEIWSRPAIIANSRRSKKTCAFRIPLLVHVYLFGQSHRITRYLSDIIEFFKNIYYYILLNIVINYNRWYCKPRHKFQDCYNWID